MTQSMFGLEVLLWGVETGSSKGILKMLNNYYGYGSYGHAALRLTLPDTPQTKQWIEQYCFKSPRDVMPAIPYAKTTTTVRDPESEGMKAKEVPCYVVYFSWWPEKLNFEYEDTLSQINTREIFYDEKWKDKLYPDGEVPTYEIHSGSIGQVLNTFMPKLTQWELNAQQPTLKHVHIRDGQEEHIEAITTEENKLSTNLQALGEQIQALGKKDPARNELCREFKKQYEQLSTIRHQILSFTSFGLDTDHTFHFPIKIDEGDFGLCARSMLEVMHHHATEYEFDLFWLNCSAATRYTLLEGMHGLIESSFVEQHGRWQLVPNLIDNPSSLFNFCLKLDSSINHARLQSLADRPKPLLIRPVSDIDSNDDYDEPDLVSPKGPRSPQILTRLT